jgi:hypothetical protein
LAYTNRAGRLEANCPTSADIGFGYWSGGEAKIMAEPLKNYFGPAVPARIASMIKQADRTFAADAFLADALDGYQALELTPRAWQIARALGRHLPQNYERAIEILIASIGPNSKWPN